MKKVEAGQRYKHFKGNEYVVLMITRDSDTLTERVVYQGQYDSPEFGSKPIWDRPLQDFIDQKEVDGKMVERFSLME